MISRVVLIVVMIMSIALAREPIDYAKTDASDMAKSKIVSIQMTICDATLGGHHGLYVKTYQSGEKYPTCKELAPLFDTVTVMPYSADKRKSGNAGSIGFGNKPKHCSLELTKTNGKLTGIPYGNKDACERIKAGGTIVLSENTKQKEDKKQVPDTPYVVKILKYDSPHGTGRSFPSKSQCEKEQARLSKANAGLDYSYKCVKR